MRAVGCRGLQHAGPGPGAHAHAWVMPRGGVYQTPQQRAVKRVKIEFPGDAGEQARVVVGTFHSRARRRLRRRRTIVVPNEVVAHEVGKVNVCMKRDSAQSTARAIRPVTRNKLAISKWRFISAFVQCIGGDSAALWPPTRQHCNSQYTWQLREDGNTQRRRSHADAHEESL